jgi:hypothetical protein
MSEGRKSESQHNSRHHHKHTIIIYPKNMKVRPVVDIIEEKHGELTLNENKVARDFKEVSESNEEAKDDKESPHKPQARTANRSRNQNFSMTKSNFNST